MKRKEAVVKSLVWRFLIAVPVSMLISYVYLDELYAAIELTVAANVVSTILYYLFDIIWFNNVSKRFKDKDVK